MKRIIVIITALVFLVPLSAQVSHGGKPALFPARQLNSVFKKVVEMAPLPAAVQQIALEKPGKKGDALRFAHPYFVEMTPENSGEWYYSHDGSRIWRVGIRSAGAYSINLIFDRFHLVPGARLFIYNPDQSYVLGAFTELNNQESGILATAPIPGDEVVVELQVPAGVGKTSSLMIGAVNHDYLNLFPHLKSGSFGDSGDCQVDFTCQDDELWSDVGRSVCKIIVDGTELCSGTMVNNTGNTGTPYFLTAAHCLKESNSASTVLFYFNYQVPNCEATIEGYPNQTLSGSNLRALAADLDFALLEMTSKPPATYRPYWAGWNLTASPAAPVLTIHHPEGDVKKMAEAIQPPTYATFSATSPSGVPFLSNSHWRVASWESGTTEPGSSGCGLFDNSGLLLGSLSGGSATCDKPVNDYFERINKAWSYYPENSRQLAYWLDRDNLSNGAWQGVDYYNGLVERLSNFTSEDIATLRYLNPGKGAWSGHNSFPAISIAEKFPLIQSATIEGVYLVTAKSVANSTKSVNVKIWSGSLEPEVLVASKTGVLLSQLPANRENLVLLNNPVTTTGPVWVEVELSYALPVDSFALFQSATLASRTINTAWIKNSTNEWIEFENAQEGNYAASFWIDLLASEVQRVDTSDSRPIDNSLLLYPNPVCDKLNIKLNLDGQARVEVFSLSGQTVLKQAVYINSGFGTVDLSALNQGLYIVKLSVNNQVFYQKIMVKPYSN